MTHPRPLSYAQRMEDIHLDRVVGDASLGVYVDVGGGHPVADNVSFHFYRKGWRGLVVEPQERWAQLARSIRPRDATECVLAGRAEGARDFHEIEGLHGFSTIRGEDAAALAGGRGVSRRIVETRTLDSLCRRHAIERIDFLKIDVEGAEADVLAGFDFGRLRPRVVLVEAVRPGDMAPSHAEWEPMLRAADYAFAFDDGLNRFYARGEEPALIERFPAAPLAWDSVDHLWDCGRALEAPRHPDAALARALAGGLLAEVGAPDFAALQRLATKGAPAAERAAIAALLADEEAARAALGRILAAYDGGFVSEE